MNILMHVLIYLLIIRFTLWFKISLGRAIM